MTNKISFNDYWKGREESLRDVLTPDGQIEILKFEAKKVWNYITQACHNKK